MKNVVVIGGGHGLSTILKGIKDIDDLKISAIVTVADDGGSTGRIRERYKIPAMGDIRNVMLTLSGSNALMKEFMNYRFEGEEEIDVEGHSLGNLMLTALTDITGSFNKAIKEMSHILKVKGNIIPSTLECVNLFARMEDDTIIKGETKMANDKKQVIKVFYDHEVEANKDAIKAIEKADLIIYGIGSIYTSILPNLIIKGIDAAIKKSKAKKVYFANVMTQASETYNYDLKKHIDALEAHGVSVDLVVTHNEKIPEEILNKYQAQDSIEVINNNDVKQLVIQRDLLDFSNGLVRHDTDKIRKVVEELL